MFLQQCGLVHVTFVQITTTNRYIRPENIVIVYIRMELSRKSNENAQK